jgi:hypothetical protein
VPFSQRAARQVFGHRHASGDDSHRLAGFMTHMVRRAPHGTPRSTGWRQARLVLKPRQFRLGTDSSSNRRATVRHPDIRGQRFRESFKRGPSVPTHPETWWRGCPLRRNHMVDVTVNFRREGKAVMGTYSHDWDCGPLSTTGSAAAAMSIIISRPNDIFPFKVGHPMLASSITMGATINLMDTIGPSNLGLGPDPVRVISVLPTSFTFETLAGHHRGVGQTIRFDTSSVSGRLSSDGGDLVPREIVLRFCIAGLPNPGAAESVRGERRLRVAPGPRRSSREPIFLPNDARRQQSSLCGRGRKQGGSA